MFKKEIIYAACFNYIWNWKSNPKSLTVFLLILHPAKNKKPQPTKKKLPFVLSFWLLYNATHQSCTINLLSQKLTCRKYFSSEQNISLFIVASVWRACFNNMYSDRDNYSHHWQLSCTEKNCDRKCSTLRNVNKTSAAHIVFTTLLQPVQDFFAVELLTPF